MQMCCLTLLDNLGFYGYGTKETHSLPCLGRRIYMYNLNLLQKAPITCIIRKPFPLSLLEKNLKHHPVFLLTFSQKHLTRQEQFRRQLHHMLHTSFPFL